jgi:ribosome-binding protein aMBF1 (putative translation factor)
MEFNQETIRELRLKMGWSQTDLARRLQTEVQVISGIEDGQIEIPVDFKMQIIFLTNQLEVLAEEIHLQPYAENELEKEGLHQVFYNDLRDKIIK